MGLKNRNELLSPTEEAHLTISFKDTSGKPIDTDSFPTISIVQPSGLVLLAPTSIGVEKHGCGMYSYTFKIPIGASLGVWTDIWLGYINGFRIESSFNFIVMATELPQVSTDGRVHLGDDPGFQYSECAIRNINKLMKSLRARLNSAGKSKGKDSFGNDIWQDTDIFSTDVLTTFLATVLWDFNQIPYFTSFRFEEDGFIDQFGEILVEGATLQALASIALLEKGREYQITDNGLSFNPPTMSELLQTQYSTLLTSYNDRLKYIKNSLRPHPRGLGLFGMNSGMNPAYRRLRHLRERRII
jgi:hypothetical protein